MGEEGAKGRRLRSVRGLGCRRCSGRWPWPVPRGCPPAGTSAGSSQQTELWAGTAGRAGSVLWTLRQSSARAGLRADYPGRVRPCRGLAASPRDLHAAAGSVVALRLPVSFAGCRPDAPSLASWTRDLGRGERRPHFVEMSWPA